MENGDTPVSEGPKTDWRLFKGLQELLTCPACKYIFRDPVTEDSGNTFCRDCLPQKSQRPYLHVNQKMQNMAQVAKQLKPFLEEYQSIEGWCTKHEEHLSFLCREDNEKICQVCCYSSLHQGHTLTQMQGLDPKQGAGALDTEQSKTAERSLQ